MELYDLYSVQSFIREIKLSLFKWVGHMACVGGEVHTGFWYAAEGKRLHEKPKHKWEDNIAMNFK